MRALQFLPPALTLVDVSPPDIPHEALIRVHRAGICATDIAITHGYAGYSGTLGHEFVGTVERCPDANWIGKRVVGEINIGCGACRRCDQGDPRHCPFRQVLGIRERNGAMAEFVSLPIRNLHLVPDGITDRQAVFLEPLAAACHVLDHHLLSPEMRIFILGDGKLAQLIGRALQAQGFQPTLVGRHPAKLALAKAAGIRTSLLTEVETDLALRRSVDAVIEATGRNAGISLALDLVSPCGIVILKSTFHEAWNLVPQKIVVPEVTLVGSRCGKMEAALDLFSTGRIEVDSLVSAEFSFTDALLAFAAAQDSQALKVQLVMN
ncbi:MAG: alcohol dehydrogenase catalytic domain-containing protein [Blastocatellia bacterium]|nr:alcohol dehydrogenase catalytic domain-containing protein [Blastocatellia bacterium]